MVFQLYDGQHNVHDSKRCRKKKRVKNLINKKQEKNLAYLIIEQCIQKIYLV